jgi:hypothetical protein
MSLPLIEDVQSFWDRIASAETAGDAATVARDVIGYTAVSLLFPHRVVLGGALMKLSASQRSLLAVEICAMAGVPPVVAAPIAYLMGEGLEAPNSLMASVARGEAKIADYVRTTRDVAMGVSNMLNENPAIREAVEKSEGGRLAGSVIRFIEDGFPLDPAYVAKLILLNNIELPIGQYSLKNDVQGADRIITLMDATGEVVARVRAHQLSDGSLVWGDPTRRDDV